MWAINSREYLPPIKTLDESNHVVWLIHRYVRTSEGKVRITEEVYRPGEFTYTFIQPESGDKMSFVYDGASVKPTFRTLRLYGAEKLQPVVAIMANIRDKKMPDGIWKKLG